LDDITKQMRGTVETFVDPRKGKNTSYTMVDAALSACLGVLHAKSLVSGVPAQSGTDARRP
jgi:hypothetical protein